MASLAKSSPKDAQVMSAILKDMGVNDHEPRIINQMLEFTYRYTTDILEDAKVYATHSKKKTIDSEDVRLAVQCRLDHSFTTPPPRDLLLDVARHKNNTSLPLVKPYTGPKLPPDRYCLCAPNYKLRTLKKPKFQMQQSAPIVQTIGGSGSQRLTIAGPSLNKAGSSTLGGTSLTLVTRAVSQPTVTIRPAVTPMTQTPNPVPIIRLTSGGSSQPQSTGNTTLTYDPNALKRKREDDDDYDQV